MRSALWLALRTLAFTVLVPCSVLAWVPYWWIAGPARVAGHWPPAASDAAPVALAVVGTLVYVVCAWRFAAEGRGTPAPWDPPRRLVTGGLYRWVRNPMYVGIPVVLLGEAWWLRSPGMLIYAIAFFAVFHARVVLYEEPTLRRMFNREFDSYCARVRRWGLF